MRFRNTTGNSIYLEDIDRHIPFEEDREFEIDVDDVKKSFTFQNLAVLGAVEIIEHGEERVEKNLIRFARERAEHAEKAEDEEPRMASGDTPEVIIKGHFYEAGGYAKVNRNLAMGLRALGTNVEINPFTTKRNDLNEFEVRALAPMKKRLGRGAIKIDSIIPSFSEMSVQHPYSILYTTVEAASIPEQFVEICNRYNEVWVTADFCKQVMEKCGVRKPIYVMPPGINLKTFHPDYEPYDFSPSLKSFVFCALGQWQPRKGWDALVRAYLTEFSGDDDVSLLVVSRYQYSSERSGVIKTEIDKLIKKYGGDNPAHIVRCRRVIPEYELPRIYKACNAFVLPSRGEGFGLPYAEASLCGLPCIATNHSGHTMFLKGDNSILVDIDRLEKIPKGSMHVHYWDDQLFPSLRSQDFIDNFGGAMRDAYDYYDEALERNERLQSLLKEQYSFRASAQRAKDRIDEIWKTLKE
tara:strand:+ start:263537 stop:264937 length:1401 start_codon:yes stop_codon:yes gene_type:complete